MKKKNILVISQVFYPEIFPINLLVYTLKKIKYKVDVLTGYPTYPKFDKYKKYFSFFPSKSYFKNIKIFRIPIIPRIDSSPLFLILNYLSFIISGLLFSPFMLFKKKIDYVFVYATSPLLQALIGIFLKKFKKSKLIIWVQDLWPESLEYTGYIKNKLILNLVKKLVIYIYNNSDLILVQSYSFKKNIKKITSTKIEVLYNPSEDFFLKQYKKKKSNKKKLKFIYAGNIGQVQSVDKIVYAAKKLKNYKNISFEIVGSGSEAKKIKELIQMNKLKNIVHKNQINYNEVKKKFQSSNVLIAILKNHQLSKQTIPSKIQAYMSSGKPILCCVPGEASEIVYKSKCGFVCKNDVESIKKMIIKINKTKTINLKKLGNNGRKFFLKNFSLKIVTSRANKLIQEI